jgi:hypothetical protein
MRLVRILLYALAALVGLYVLAVVLYVIPMVGGSHRRHDGGPTFAVVSLRMDIRRSAMSDAALSERRAAALESSAPSNTMKPSASKTW